MFFFFITRYRRDAWHGKMDEWKERSIDDGFSGYQICTMNNS